MRDNTQVDPPGTFASGYHLSADLVDEAIRTLADHQADCPRAPWHLWLAFGACHAPHQAPLDLIRRYDAEFAHGWDVERERRLNRQKAMGLVPADTELPRRNAMVGPWHMHSPDEQRVFTRLQAAFAAMLDHADQQIARLMTFIESTGQLGDTLVVVLSDNGASQEGGLVGMVNAMGPYNLQFEPIAKKLANLDLIGGPASHANFPHGWAMASNTPLKRYKQNTHGGGIRDPLVIAWPRGIAARGQVAHNFCHASDLAPTLLEAIGIAPPATLAGLPCRPITGTSFAATFRDPAATTPKQTQYFEMFGHRGIVHNGWKAVAYHETGTDFAADTWELNHLEKDFAENHDLAAREPERLARMIDAWWGEAEANQVLPLDDRFGPRFAENAERYHGERRRFVFHRGMGHLPTDVAPDVRRRSYAIEVDARLDADASGKLSEGVLIAHGDATSGYTLYVRDGRLVHDLNFGGNHAVLASDRALTAGNHSLEVRVTRGPARSPHEVLPPAAAVRMGLIPGAATIALWIDGEPAGQQQTAMGFATLISWSGLDIGRDRGSPVGDYAAPFAFTGLLRKVTVTIADDSNLDAEAAARAALARE